MASGPDGISSRMLKNTHPSISLSLAALYNASFRLGKIPADWKSSRVVPIPKPGDPSLAKNYRPISLLPLVSKIQERVVHNVLWDHIHLSFSQYCFRPGSSTQEAILAALRDWHHTLESGGSVVCVFLDLSKAFDSLPHSLVLKSLIRVGVGGGLLRWFVDYLDNRKQQVALKGSSSPCASVTSGVPQGSILGPLLFILAMDPVTSLSISNSGVIRVYADDINYYKPIMSSTDLLAVQNDVDTISVWVGDNGLRLNATKTKSLVISRKRAPPVPNISMDGTPIEQVSSFKLLGVTVSENLSWHNTYRRLAVTLRRFLASCIAVLGLQESCV